MWLPLADNFQTSSNNIHAAKPVLSLLLILARNVKGLLLHLKPRIRLDSDKKL
jgi:hypothetical protein